MLKELCKSVKPVGTRPGTMHRLCKVHKEVGGCFPFQPVLLTLSIPQYNLAKFLVPILNPSTKTECRVKDSF